jgi:hypothetical protein
LECFKCVHRGKFIGVPYEETPCAACELRENSTQTVEFDEALAAGPVRWPLPVESAVADQLPVSVLDDAVNILVGLKPREFEIVRLRFRGETLPDIAARLGAGVYEVRAQLRKLLRKSPVLKKLIPAVHARKGPKPKAARDGL